MVEKGFDIYTSLSLLTTYLGHKNVTDTEYYLRFVNENFSVVTKLSEKYITKIFPDVDKHE
jgi:hypothetical protein